MDSQRQTLVANMSKRALQTFLHLPEDALASRPRSRSPRGDRNHMAAEVPNPNLPRPVQAETPANLADQDGDNTMPMAMWNYLTVLNIYQMIAVDLPGLQQDFADTKKAPRVKKECPAGRAVGFHHILPNGHLRFIINFCFYCWFFLAWCWISLFCSPSIVWPPVCLLNLHAPLVCRDLLPLWHLIMLASCLKFITYKFGSPPFSWLIVHHCCNGPRYLCDPINLGFTKWCRFSAPLIGVGCDYGSAYFAHIARIFYLKVYVILVPAPWW